MRRLWIIGAVLALVGAAAVIARHPRVTAGRPTPRSTARSTGVQQVAVSIPASDGVRLAGYLITPARALGRPLLVMPAAWGAGSDQYRSISRRAVALGFDVVAYAQRGFGGSGGLADLAGPRTQADVSDVISWALSRTAADPSRIGALGLSYGGGVSLLAAARDSRIRAVVAMSTWADLASVFAPRGTVKSGDLALLLRGRAVAPELRQLQASVASPSTARAAEAARTALVALSPSRSPASAVAELNHNGTAVLIANAYEDSLFQPSDIVSFFTRLTGPKRLLLGPGDHVAPLTPAYASSSWWTSAFAWFNGHVADARAVAGAAVQLTDATTRRTSQYGSWPSRSITVSLGPARTRSITAGRPSTADSGAQQLSTARNYSLPQLKLASVDPKAAAVWNSASARSALHVCGSPSVRLAVQSSTSATLYAYLYDVDPLGAGRLMTTAPYSVGGAARTVDIALEPTCWTVAASHHLALIVDTVDARYVAASRLGSTVTVAGAAELTIPVAH